MFQSWRVPRCRRMLWLVVGLSVITTALCCIAARTASAAPAVTATTPASGAIGVPVGSRVSAVFSQAMDPVTLTGATVTLSHFDGIQALAAGYAHTVLLKNSGGVVAWGDNSLGQTSVPAGLSGVTAVAAGESHTVALKSDGKVVAWGRNDYQQTSAPAGLSGVAAVAAGFGHTVALKRDGTVVAWGLNSSGQATVPVGLSGVVAIAAGSFHTVALKGDGTVVAWGRNYSGQATVPAGLSGVAAIAAGWYHTVALKSDGTLVSWGENSSGQTAVPVALAGVKVTAVAAGAYHTVALREDRTLVAWGLDDYGQATLPSGLSGVAALAAGAYHTLALKDDGTATGWGRDSFGQATVDEGVYRTSDVGAVSYDFVGKTAIFTPSSRLPYSTTFTATVTNGVRSLTGGNPAGDYSWNFTTVSDTTPPTVTVTVPVLGTSGNSTATPKITYSASDGTTVVKLDGQVLVITNNANLPHLADGKHTLTIESTDYAGNQGVASIDFYVDTVSPTLLLSTLADKAVTGNAILNVSGYVTDSSGSADYASGVGSLSVNGVAVAPADDGSFSFALALVEGDNSVATVLTDKAGNRTADARTITLSKTAPALTLSTPADNSSTAESWVVLSGVADGNCIVQFVVGAGAKNDVAGTNFTATAYLEPGLNTVQVWATDLATGKVSAQKRSVSYDAAKMSLAITSPAQDVVVSQNTLTLTGTVADALSDVTITVADGTTSHTPAVTDGAFTQALTFTEGKTYPITVTAADSGGGRIASSQRNVIYRPIKGDLDGDGKVLMADALRALRYALNLIPHDAVSDAHYLALADVAPLDPATMKPKGDGKINILDVLVLLQRSVDLLSW